MYEYKVVSAPNTGPKKKGLKRVEDRFAAQLEQTINALAAERWEYVRADTLPCEERAGLTSKSTRFHALLVFRRPVPEENAEPHAAPEPVAARMPSSETEKSPEVLSVLRDMKGPTRQSATEDDAPDAAPKAAQGTTGDARP